MSKTVISTKNVTKFYGKGDLKVEALKGVDLTIAEGEFTAIVGPSGSGKTTLLNIIGGLDKATSGKVEIANQDLSLLNDNELIDFRLWNIGFVFQAYNLVPVLTAFENTEFVMLMQNQPKTKREERCKALLEEVGLLDQMHKKPSEMSGGQQQRVAVARALAAQPRFVLADEPTANLDSVSTHKLLTMMKELNRKEHMTFVFSTHDQRVIDQANRIVQIEDGEIVSDKNVQ